MRGIHALTLVTGWIVIMGLFVVASRTEAASGDADGTYTVTLTKVEISKDSGITYTTLFEGSQAINIAAADAGAVAAGLASGVTLAPGTYDTVRVTLDPTMQLKAYVNNDDDDETLYTDGGTEDGSGASTSNNEEELDTPGEDYAASTYTIPEADRIDTKAGLSIKVEAGTSTVVDVAFDTAGTASESVDEVIIPGAPTVTITSR